MKKIDIATWSRKQHFEFFRHIASPMYNTCFNVNITNLLAFTRARRLSFNTAMVHITLTAANAIENLKYRLHEDEVIQHDMLHPVFAHIRKGEELFGLVHQQYEDDLSTFASKAKQKADTQVQYFPMDELKGRDDLVFISALPWISFTGVDHTASLKKEDAIPRITWGKYRTENGKTLLPFNIQVNHIFVDGLHVGQFKDKLDETIGRI